MNTVRSKAISSYLSYQPRINKGKGIQAISIITMRRSDPLWFHKERRAHTGCCHGVCDCIYWGETKRKEQKRQCVCVFVRVCMVGCVCVWVYYGLHYSSWLFFAIWSVCDFLNLFTSLLASVFGSDLSLIWLLLTNACIRHGLTSYYASVIEKKMT